MKKILICLVGLWLYFFPVVAQQKSNKDVGIPLNSALNDIVRLSPIQTLKPDQEEYTEKIYSFDTDEFEKVFPELTYYRLAIRKSTFAKNAFNNTVRIKEIDYQSLIPVLVAAVKEQQAIIKKQQEQIEYLMRMVPPQK